MHIDILTIFPKIFDSPLKEAMLNRAKKKGVWDYSVHDIRKYSKDKHRSVDDTPYGGGAGMLMKPEPIFDCVMDVKKNKKSKFPVIYMSSKGKILTQKRAEKFSKLPGCIVLCGRYEGVDQRVVDEVVDEEISIGKYILAGGEFAALVFIETVVRLIPEALGNSSSVLEESFSKKLNGKKEYPQFTRPAIFRGKKVPDVLVSGNHKKIEEWRQKNLG